MVDEPLQPNDREAAPPEWPNGRPSRPTWLGWIVAVLLGLAGFVFQYLRGRSAGQAASSGEGPPPSGHEEELPPEEIRHPDGRIEHPRISREKSDLSARWIYIFLVAAACIAAVHYYVIWRLYWSKAAAQREEKRPPYPVSPIPSERLPPEPRLEQLDRLADIESANVYKRLAAKELLLHRYGPEAEPGFVHVPIERAMQVVASELPVRAATTSSPRNNGLVDWGESNSGRMFRGERPWEP